jgi:hypothetical protein
LFTGPHTASWKRAATSVVAGVPITVRHLDHLTSRAMGIAAHGALLARPDGAPVGCWSAPLDAFRTLYDAVTSITALPESTTAALNPRSAA